MAYGVNILALFDGWDEYNKLNFVGKCEYVHSTLNNNMNACNYITVDDVISVPIRW